MFPIFCARIFINLTLIHYLLDTSFPTPIVSVRISSRCFSPAATVIYCIAELLIGIRDSVTNSPVITVLATFSDGMIPIEEGKHHAHRGVIKIACHCINTVEVKSEVLFIFNTILFLQSFAQVLPCP